MLRASLENLYIQSEELRPMQRKSHLKNYTKSLYVSGLLSEYGCYCSLTYRTLLKNYGAENNATLEWSRLHVRVILLFV
jgi:hypothetical protein